MKLTQQQLEQFDREGYLFLPNLFSKEEAAFLKGEAEAIYQQDRQEVWREKVVWLEQRSPRIDTTKDFVDSDLTHD
jgi:hypothetical protein